MGVVYERDTEGNVLNPPINQDFEWRLYQASQRADQVEVNEIQDEYNQWREDKISRDEAREEDQRNPEVKLTAQPPSSGNAVTGAPQNIIIPPEVDTQGPVTEAMPTVTDGPKIETYESPMADPAFFDKLAAAITKAQGEQSTTPDSVQAATEGEGPRASEVTDLPSESATPVDLGNVPPEGGN